jgi:hypothetical protein
MGNHGSLAVIAALTTRFLIGKRTAFCLYHHAGGVLMCTAIGADGLNLHMIMLFLQTGYFYRTQKLYIAWLQSLLQRTDDVAVARDVTKRR